VTVMRSLVTTGHFRSDPVTAHGDLSLGPVNSGAGHGAALERQLEGARS
jgi:hypothetical protein